MSSYFWHTTMHSLCPRRAAPKPDMSMLSDPKGKIAKQMQSWQTVFMFDILSCLPILDNVLRTYEVVPEGNDLGGAKRSRMSAVIRTRKGRSFARQSGEFVHGALTSQLHISFAQIIPEITTASIPPPGKVEAPTKYRPFIGVLK